MLLVKAVMLEADMYEQLSVKLKNRMGDLPAPNYATVDSIYKSV